MANLHQHWAVYARLQASLSRRNKLDDYAWGLEAGLNLISCPEFSATELSPDDFQRAVSSAARKERDHAARFLSFGQEPDEHPAPGDLVERLIARDALVAIAALLPPRDLQTISSVGAGYSYRDLALQSDESEVNLRTRVFRIRRVIEHIDNPPLSRRPEPSVASENILARTSKETCAKTLAGASTSREVL